MVAYTLLYKGDDVIFLPDERVLPDDYPIFGDYFYLADGKVYRSDYHQITVADLKRREKFTEVRNCNWRRFNGTNAQIEALAEGRPITPPVGTP